jgi:hypothetical protein
MRHGLPSFARNAALFLLYPPGFLSDGSPSLPIVQDVRPNMLPEEPVMAFEILGPGLQFAVGGLVELLHDLRGCRRGSLEMASTFSTNTVRD